MVKVISIDHIELYKITCSLNNGSKRVVDVKPLIQNHLHLGGITELLKEDRFLSAEIGKMGEILWKNIIRTTGNELWDYDISPEFIFYEGRKLGGS